MSIRLLPTGRQIVDQLDEFIDKWLEALGVIDPEDCSSCPECAGALDEIADVLDDLGGILADLECSHTMRHESSEVPA